MNIDFIKELLHFANNAGFNANNERRRLESQMLWDELSVEESQ